MHWRVLFPPQSLEVGPVPHSPIAAMLKLSGIKHPQLTFRGSPRCTQAWPLVRGFSQKARHCGSILPAAIQKDLSSKWQVNKLRKQILVNFVVHSSQNMSRPEDPIWALLAFPCLLKASPRNAGDKGMATFPGTAAPRAWSVGL